MKTSETSKSAWHDITLDEEFVSSGVTDDRAFEIDGRGSEWNGIIDSLIEWGNHPSRIDEDELESPSLMAIDLAYEVLRFIKDDLHFLPSRVVSDGEGGIQIEKDSPGDGVLRFEISGDGALELLQFEGTNLTFREQLPTRRRR